MVVAAPCYNYNQHQDCDKRHVGCHISCNAWDKYVTARNSMYEERKAHANAYFKTGEARRKSLEKSMRRGRRLWS